MFIVNGEKTLKRKTTSPIEIFPTEEQKLLIGKEIQFSAFVYNYFLMYRFNLWKNEKKNIKFFEELDLLQVLKEENEWLKNVENASLEQAIRDLDTDYYNFFTQNGNYPKCRKKDDKIQWYKTRNDNESIKLYDKEKIIKMPYLGHIRFETKEDAFLDGKISYAKIIKIENKYELILTLEIQ